MIAINAAKFKDVVKTIDKYGDIINVFFDDNGAYALLDDANNVSRCKINMTRSWFDVYQPTVHKIYLARKNLEHIAKMCTNDSSIILTLDKDAKTINANFYAGKINYKASFTRIADTSANEIRDISERALASFESIWSIYDLPSADFAKCIDSLKLAYSEASYLSKAVSFKITDSELQLAAGDMMTDSGVIECSIDVYIKKKMYDSSHLFMEFPTDYIEILKNQISIYKTETVELYCAENVPMLMQINGHDNECVVKTLIAPRVAQNE